MEDRTDTSKSQGKRELNFSFDDTLVTGYLPKEFSSKPVSGTLSGSWTTRFSSLTEFEVTSLEAALVLNDLSLTLPGEREATHRRSVTIPLSLSKVDVPKGLHQTYPFVNAGTFDLRSRFTHTIMGLTGSFPGEKNPRVGPVDILLQTQGYVQSDGSVISGGVANIIGGWLAASLLFCGGPKSSTTPATPNPITFSFLNNTTDSGTSGAVKFDIEVGASSTAGKIKDIKITSVKHFTRSHKTPTAIDSYTNVDLADGDASHDATVGGSVHAGEGSFRFEIDETIQAEFEATDDAGNKQTFIVEYTLGVGDSTAKVISNTGKY